MTAPTYTSIVAAAAEAIHALECTDDYRQEAALVRLAHHDAAERIVSVVLRALGPLVAEWDMVASAYTQLADDAFREGDRDIAANVWRAIADTHARHAHQVRALMPSPAGREVI